MSSRRNTTFFAKVLGKLNSLGDAVCAKISQFAESSGEILTDGCRFLTVATCVYMAVHWEHPTIANTIALFTCTGWAMGNLASVAAGKREIGCALKWPLTIAVLISIATALQN